MTSVGRLTKEDLQQPESDAARVERLKLEALELDKAREDIRAGRAIADEDVDAWLEAFATGGSLPRTRVR